MLKNCTAENMDGEELPCFKAKALKDGTCN